MSLFKKKIEVGTVRINSRSLKPSERTKTGWKHSKKEFPELQLVAKLFKSQKRFKELVDKKNPEFLKGQLSKEGREQGARINILPTGEKLEKAFSLFSPHLRIHDQDSHDHWDVLYQNKGGGYSYVYTVAKRKAHRARKYKKVEVFDKHYHKLKKNVEKGLFDGKDYMALPMHTLLNTYMRIGNEVYYKAHGHKGLSTLMKKDVRIKGNSVSFAYLGKDGVPIDIKQKFSSQYVKRLKGLLKGKKANDFIFSIHGHPLHERDFKIAFEVYCGHEFYPHIIRSHYATKQVKDFISRKKSISKDQVESLYLSVASALGHKKFNKKTGMWQVHHVVTVNSYIQPELVAKVEKMIK